MLEVGIDDVDNLITLSNRRNAVEIYKKKIKTKNVTLLYKNPVKIKSC